MALYRIAGRTPPGLQHRHRITLSARVRPLAVPFGKDVTEFWQQGGDLRAWVQELVGE